MKLTQFDWTIWRIILAIGLMVTVEGLFCLPNIKYAGSILSIIFIGLACIIAPSMISIAFSVKNANMSDSLKDVLVTLAGFIVTIAANVLLVAFWIGWSHSSWADCPNYAFSKTWYPEPPIPVTFLPLLLTTLEVVWFARRLSATPRQKPPLLSLVSGAGLMLNFLPLLASIVLPAISDWLHLSKAGC